MAKVRKGKLFSLFEKDFKISFFYKPSMATDDVFHYVVLDNTVRLTIRVFNNTVLVIHDIVPLTEAYLSKYYDKLISFLINQTMFTVLISRFGNTTCINDSCIKLNVPTVEDDTFITVPRPLYDLYKKKITDVNKWGFYLLAVTDNLSTVKESMKNEQVTPVEVINTREVTEETVINSPAGDLISHICNSTRFRNITKHEHEGSPNITLDIDNGIGIIITIDDREIHIIDVTLSATASLVDMMDVFVALETYDSDIYIDNIKDIRVFKMCESRKYQKIVDYKVKPRADRFGTYKIVKLQ